MKAKFWKAAATTAVSLALALPTTASANATPAHDVTSPIERSRVDSVPTPTIRWKGCGDNLECATVQLPLDYDKPNAQQISIGLTRIPARNPEARIGSLFLNPGGPGASGTEFPQRATQWLGDDVQDRFDLIGMDPRGINQSTNTECFPNMKILQRRLAALAIGFPMTAAETDEYLAATRAIGKACSTKGKKMASSVSTAQVARDMDVIRRALGDEQLSFLGFSYGSFLGQTYANMFPDKVRAVAIDGVLDPLAWVGTPQSEIPVSVRLQAAVGSDRAFTELLERCEANPEACPLADPKKDAAAVFARLAEAPMLLDVPEIGQVPLTYQELITTFLYALYDPMGGEEVVYFLADLKAMIEEEQVGSVRPETAGSAQISFQKLERRAKENKEAYMNAYEIPLAVMCSDSHNPYSSQAWRDLEPAVVEATPVFGKHWLWGSAGCAGESWRVKDEDAYTGPFNRATANPLLVVGNLWDPSTAYEGAVAAAEVLPNSALITSHNWGHTAYGNSQCATDAVDRYLIDGVVPDGELVCTDAPQPFER